MKNINDISWNANAAYLQEIINQMERVNIALSSSNLVESIEAVRTFYDTSCSKTNDSDDEAFNSKIDKITGAYMNYLTVSEVQKVALSVSLSSQIHSLYREIIRLMVKNKLIKLDPDDLDPVDEVSQDY